MKIGNWLSSRVSCAYKSVSIENARPKNLLAQFVIKKNNHNFAMATNVQRDAFEMDSWPLKCFKIECNI